MLISSPANAAQAVAAQEETRFYDDIGCLAADEDAMRGNAQLFVQLANGTGWAPVESLWFAASPGINTPMAYGFAAFPSEAEARRADITGTAHRWEDIVRRTARNGGR